MNKSVWGVALLMIAVVFSGCSTMEAPISCYENQEWSCDAVEKWAEDEVDLVCNMAATLADACEAFLLELPEGMPTPPICERIPEELGTCQPVGIAGDICAEDADCAGTCPEGVCVDAA